MANKTGPNRTVPRQEGAPLQSQDNDREAGGEPQAGLVWPLEQVPLSTMRRHYDHPDTKLMDIHMANLPITTYIFDDQKWFEALSQAEREQYLKQIQPLIDDSTHVTKSDGDEGEKDTTQDTKGNVT